MKLFKLIEEISKILTPDTNSLYPYIRFSEDNGRFLRTPSNKKNNNKLKNIDIPNFDEITVYFNKEFTEDYYDNDLIKLKMQLFYFKGDIEDVILINYFLGYIHSYIFNIKERSYQYKLIERKDLFVIKSDSREKRMHRKLFE